MVDREPSDRAYTWGTSITPADINTERQTLYQGETISPVLLTVPVTEQEINSFYNAYPKDLLDRYSLHLLATRARIHAWIKNILLEARKTKEPGVKTQIEQAQSSPNMMLPRRIHELSHSYDFIASALVRQKGSAKSALVTMENVDFTKTASPTGYYEQGVGKTGLAFVMLGIKDFSDHLPKVRPGITEVEFGTHIILPSRQTNISAVSLDHTYAGLDSEGRIVVSPIAGVAGFDGQSDAARHASRVMTAKEGRVYNRLIPPDSEYFPISTRNIMIANSVFEHLDSLIPWEGTVGVNFIRSQETAADLQRKLTHFGTKIEEIRKDNGAWISLEIIESPREVWDRLLPLLRGNPMYHPSPGWAGKDPNPRRNSQSGINPDHQIRTINALADHLPQNLAFLYIFPGADSYKPDTAPEIFQRSSELINDWWKSW